MFNIHNSQINFHDGRSVLLRGINISGANKSPYKKQFYKNKKDFFHEKNLSFIGHPFPLSEAKTHFERLHYWGFNAIRFVIPWEALEHQGPGKYDLDYMDYVRKILECASSFGFFIFIDPHQDVWSRFCGGSGAPKWTMDLCGLEPSAFEETGAAIIQHISSDQHTHMTWPTNSTKLGCATMFSLFFGGNIFASKMDVDGIPLQDYLQEHFCLAYATLAKKLKKIPNLVGFESMNEPLLGYIGMKNLNQIETPLKLGPTPTPYESMLLGSGFTVSVAHWKKTWLGLKQKGKEELNTNQQSCWKEGSTCIWKEHGVWGIDGNGVPKLLIPDYFYKKNGKEVNFNKHFFKPFLLKYINTIRRQVKETAFLIQPPFGHRPPTWESSDPPNIIFSPHWYDAFILFMKRYFPFLAVDTKKHKVFLGLTNMIKKLFSFQLNKLQKQGWHNLLNAPTIIGEFGIPFNLTRSQTNWSVQAKAINRSFTALEHSLLHGIIWNYNTLNTQEQGDLWNDEDLSIFSQEAQTNVTCKYAGGRALEAIVRPYPQKINGTLRALSFNIKTKECIIEFTHHSITPQPTEIFIPHLHYKEGYYIKVSDGSYIIKEDEQLLFYYHDAFHHRHKITILPKQ